MKTLDRYDVLIDMIRREHQGDAMRPFRLTAKRKATMVQQFRHGWSVAEIAGYWGGLVSKLRIEQVIREAMTRRAK